MSSTPIDPLRVAAYGVRVGKRAQSPDKNLNRSIAPTLEGHLAHEPCYDGHAAVWRRKKRETERGMKRIHGTNKDVNAIRESSTGVTLPDISRYPGVVPNRPNPSADYCDSALADKRNENR